MTPTYGYPRLTAHGAARIAQRFGAETEADALLWALRRMAAATRARTVMRRGEEPRVVWEAPDGVRIVTDGNCRIITAYRVGDVEMEAAG